MNRLPFMKNWIKYSLNKFSKLGKRPSKIPVEILSRHGFTRYLQDFSHYKKNVGGCVPGLINAE